MKTLHQTLLPVILVATLSGWLVADRSAQDPSGSVRFLNVQACFDQYQAAQEEIAALSATFSGRMEGFRAREAKLLELEGELAILDPASPEFMRRRHELEGMKMTLERDMQFTGGELQLAQSQLFVRSYQAVEAAAAELAAREGYSAVLVIPDGTNQLPEDPQQALDYLRRRNIVWTNPNFNVSDAVAAILNGES